VAGAWLFSGGREGGCGGTAAALLRLALLLDLPHRPRTPQQSCAHLGVEVGEGQGDGLAVEAIAGVAQKADARKDAGDDGQAFGRVPAARCGRVWRVGGRRGCHVTAVCVPVTSATG
jgi:hypothetical protein